MNFSNSIKDGIRGIFCELANDAANFQSWFTTFPVPGSGPSNDIELFRRFNFARMAYRNLCNREPPPVPDPPFFGGQCEGIPYNVYFDLQYEQYAALSGTWEFRADTRGPSTAIGPITNIYVVEKPGTVGGVAVTDYEIWMEAADDPNPEFPETTVLQARNLEIQIRVERVDGLPDDCGNLLPDPVPPPPPGWNRDDIDITYEGDDGNTYNLTFPIVFGYADLDVNGNFYIPFRINVAPTFTGNFDIELNGRFTFGGPGADGPDFDIDFDFGGDGRDDRRVGPGGGPPRFPTDYDTDLDDEEPPEPFDDAQEEEEPPERASEEGVIRAAWVITTQNSANFPTTIPQQENPDVYVPDLGLISFGIRAGQRSIGWTEDIRIKNTNQFVPCPWDGGAVLVRGTPRPGVTWRIIPLYAKDETPVIYPE